MSDPSTTSNDRTSSTRAGVIVGIVVIVAALVGALVLFTSNDDDDAVPADSTTAQPTTAQPTTVAETASPTTTATTVADTEPVTAPTVPSTSDTPTTEPPTTERPIEGSTRDAIWPWAETATRFTDPVEAATSFAVDYLGFADPVVGEFRAGDARSGEIVLQAGPVGPTTVVFVRQLTDDDSWWVLGAAAENITIEEPNQGATVTSPLNISGAASAFEGTVDVELRVDGSGEAIYEGFVTGSGSPEPGPYTDTVEFDSPGAIGGALVLISRTPQNGSPVLEASARRIFFD